MEQSEAPLYYVWGVDHVAYGPVELPPLVNWIRDERVFRDTWIFEQKTGKWTPAGSITELQGMFKTKPQQGPQPGPKPAAAGAQGVSPSSLRRVKVLAELNDEQLASFARYLEVQKVPQFAEIVHAGEQGDTMFMVAEGELRVRVMVNGKESILATLSVGESFGELALLDQGKRSADVIANVDSLLLSISSSGLDKVFQEAPALAAPFLRALARATAARLRSTNKRFEDSIRMARASH